MLVTEQHWEAIGEWLKIEMGEGSYKSWIAPLSIDSDEQTLTLKVPTEFMQDWVEKHYDGLIKKGVSTVIGADVDIKYAVCTPIPASVEVEGGAAESSAKESSDEPDLFSMMQKPSPQVTSATVQAEVSATPDFKSSVVQSVAPQAPKLRPQPAKGQYEGNPLDPRFTFSNFVTGKSNEFAYAAAKRIAESMDMSYNPFFMYGGVGLGKTHLMHAMAFQIMEIFPGRRVLYISAEKFLNNFISALKNKNTSGFKETFRNVDVLMIDDIQFIAGKDATQEEFFHTFNSLINDKKQIILTADRSPHEMSSIEDRLRSRLGWGLATEIHRPDLETRLAILENKANQLGIQLQKDVAMFLADKIDSNVRELEGALNRLAAHATLVKTEITVDTAFDLLRDLFRHFGREVQITDVQKKVAEYYNIKMSDMSSSRRSRSIARPRQVAMFLCKQLTTKSFPEIGKAFGGRDHTTVMHAVKTIESLEGKDPSLKEDVRLLENVLKNV